jgi:thioredoxin-like negative regulator of GroEL
MMLHVCATLVQLTVLASGNEGGETYKEAHRQMTETGRPLVVMVGADWCGPCQNMEKKILPQVRKHGLFRKVSFAVVNVDREQKLAEQLTGGGPIPQLVLYRKTRKGWFRRKLVGSQSVEDVEKFIKEELVENRAKGKGKTKNPAKDSPAPSEKSRTTEAVKVSRSG